MKKEILWTIIAALVVPTALFAQSAPPQPAPAAPRSPMEAQLDEARRSNQTMHQIVTDDRMQIGNLAARVRDVADRNEISAVIFHQTLAAMDEQQDALELEHVAQQARIDAIQAAISHTTGQAAKKAADDPTVVELSTVVDAREHALEMVKAAHGMGNASENQVADAEAQAAEARAQVDLRRENVFAANGGDIVTALS